MKLDKNNQVKDSLMARKSDFVRGIDFDLNNDRGIIPSAKIKDASITTAKIADLAVTSAKIDSFSFNQGAGGTIALGGTANGDGVMLVKDSSGVTKVTADNTGLVITGGKLTFLNTVGGTVVDSQGVVSSTVFATDDVTDLSVRTTTSTVFTPVSGGSLTTFILARASKVLINVLAQGYNIKWLSDASTMSMACIDSIDGTLISFPMYIESKLSSVSGTGSPYSDFGYSIDYQVQNISAFIDMTAGTHSMGLQFRVDGTGTAEITTTQLAYVILGN